MTTDKSDPAVRPRRRGKHARPTIWSRAGPGIAAAVGLVVVAGYRLALLAARHEPNGVDFGNWLLLGHTLLGSPVPQAADIAYPPMIPILSVLATELGGATWGSSVLYATTGVAPGIGLYLAARLNGIRWAAVMPAILLAATSSTGEAVAWGGAPQLLGFGFAALGLGAAVRLLRERRLSNAVWFSASFVGVAATSHLVTAQLTLTLAVLVAVTWAVRGRTLFAGRTWRGPDSWVRCLAVIVIPLLAFVPLYAELLGTVGASFASRTAVDPGGSALGDFSSNLDVVARDAAWFWRPLLLGSVLMPVGLLSRRLRAARVWPLAAAAVISVLIQGLGSSQDRLVYFAPLAVGFSLIAGIDAALSVRVQHRLSQRLLIGVAGLLITAGGVASITGLAYFSVQRDFYARFTPEGTVAGLSWIRTHTPDDAVMLVAPEYGAPFGWWVQGYAQRGAYVASSEKWLNFPVERERARRAVAILTTDNLFGDDVQHQLSREDIDFLVLPWAWGGVDAQQIRTLQRAHPAAVPYLGKAIVVIDVAELP